MNTYYSKRITRADIKVQTALVAAYSSAAGVIQDDDRLTVTRAPSGYTLMVIRAGGSGLSSYPATGGYGVIGTTARDALHTLDTIAKTLSATLDALNVPRAYPAAEIAAIRGEGDNL